MQAARSETRVGRNVNDILVSFGFPRVEKKEKELVG
jgi:hypothetical protein